MAADNSYPRFSIEDDFNYGSNVASAHIQIRMGKRKGQKASSLSLWMRSIIRFAYETAGQQPPERIWLLFSFNTIGFLRKVYSILSVQLLLTTVTTALFLYFDSVRTFVHESFALLVISAIGSLCTVIALTVYRHQYPFNLYLLTGFTVLETVTVAITVTFYDVAVVLQALVLTVAVFLALTTYTFQSKRDFSKFGAGLFTGLLILILAGFLRLFLYSETLDLVIAAAGALLFCGFIIYDTHVLMHKLSPEEYILASINLYLDIINLFLHLLRLLEALNKK